MKVTINLTKKEILQLTNSNHPDSYNGELQDGCCHYELCSTCDSVIDKVVNALGIKV